MSGRVAIIALMALTVVGLTACGPSTNGTPDASGAGALGSAGSSSTAAVGPASPSPTPASPTNVGGGGGANADCTIDHLNVAPKPTGGAAGHLGKVIVFTNTGDKVCRLFGYPGVAGLNAGGDQVAQAARTLNGYMGGIPSGKNAEALFLSKGESASAVIESLAFNAADGSACTAFAGILVTPPNETHSVKLAWDSNGCSALQIHPVVLGTTGQG